MQSKRKKEDAASAAEKQAIEKAASGQAAAAAPEQAEARTSESENSSENSSSTDRAEKPEKQTVEASASPADKSVETGDGFNECDLEDHQFVNLTEGESFIGSFVREYVAEDKGGNDKFSGLYFKKPKDMTRYILPLHWHLYAFFVNREFEDAQKIDWSKESLFKITFKRKEAASLGEVCVYSIAHKYVNS